MKNKLFEHSIKKIKDNYKRFISLFFLSLLGVGFFGGIKATSPDMLDTLDKFYDDSKVYDIEVLSTSGFSDDDKNEISKLESVENVVGSYYKDVYVDIEDKEYILRMLPISSDINKVYLDEGEMPSNKSEILVDEKFASRNDLSIGDSLIIDNDTFKIVGFAVSPLYFSTDRGTTNLGDGKVDFFGYVLEEDVVLPYYTNLYVTVKGAKEKTTFTDSYKDLVTNSMDEINSIKKERESSRDYILSLMGNTSKTKWYVFDRSNNAGYKDLTDASVNLERLGNVFPLVFYVVAILISLISMKRMIEEDRTENGTLKSLGFTNFQITNKYIIYSLLGALSGGLVGLFIGFNLIPSIIWNIYGMLFYIPGFVCKFNFKYAFIGLAFGILSITGTAIYASYKNLKNKPAILMRPKAPKPGKKILFEKIPFIWNHLNFSNKITIRNIFRYKGRVIATIIGISGCTALILAGFSLKDSLKDISVYHFENVFHYDKIVSLKPGYDYDEIINDLNSNKDVNTVTLGMMDSVTVRKDEKKQDAVLFILDDIEKIDEVVTLKDMSTSVNVVPSDDGIIISEKLSELLNLNTGDMLTFTDNNNQAYQFKISHVVENYVNHYVYLTKETYNKISGNYNNNTLFINMKDNLEQDVLDNFDKKLLSTKEISSIVNSKEMIDMIGDMMNSLDSVVLILIVSSMLLSFVVLYNLSNINISERKREIATLKVLGFYPSEVDHYITKENIILTFIGILIGLCFGTYLGHYIISTCEPDYIMFVRSVNIASYVYSAVITVLFTAIVNFVTHFNLKKIDMIESLKNVE